MVKCELIVDEELVFAGLATERILVTANGRLELQGMCAGDLIIETGGSAEVYGTVQGTVRSKGFFRLHGTVDGNVISTGHYERSAGAVVRGRESRT